MGNVLQIPPLPCIRLLAPNNAIGDWTVNSSQEFLMGVTTGTIGMIVVSMALVAVVEWAIPLHQRGRWHQRHLRPNLALTAITIGTNIVFNTALGLGLLALEAAGYNPVGRLIPNAAVGAGVTVLWLDFSFYVAHVAMHKIPGWWRYHRVHHSDPALDVTTTIRQHPGESVIRYGFLAVAALAVGASPAAFSVYRLWSALSGLLEHSNIRISPRLDRALSLVFTWPNMHKVHHSRAPHETDSNYGNIVSWFDRLFGTFTPSSRGLQVRFGLDRLDAPEDQTTWGLLRMPFRNISPAAPRELPVAEHWAANQTNVGNAGAHKGAEEWRA